MHWLSVFFFLTSRFDLGEEGSHLLALHDVGDDMARDFWAGAVGDNDGGATLQSPQSSLHLQKTKQQPVF